MNDSKIIIRLGLEYTSDDGSITAIDTKFPLTFVELARLKPEHFIADEYTALYLKLEQHIKKLDSLPDGKGGK